MADDLERRITARMVLDSSGFNTSLQGVNNNLKVAQSELKNASAQVGAFGRDSETLRGVQQALAQQIELQSQKVNIYRDSIEKTTEKMEANIAERDRLKASLASTNTTIEATIREYGEESNEVGLVREGISNLTDQIARQERAVETNARQINTYTTNLNNTEAELNRTRQSLNTTNSEIANNESRWISAGKTLEATGDKMKKLGDGMSSAGDTLLKISAPLVGAGVASLKFANDFEDSMAAVSTVADNTSTSMDDLKKGIVNLSNDTGKSVEDLSAGLYDAISSGVKTADSINFMTEATKAAVGGFTDTKTSVDGLTTVLNSYGLKATEVTNISNQMMVAQNLGKTTFGEMAESIGNVSATSAALGVNTKELFSSLATLTANGIKTSEAVSGLKAAFSNVIKPSVEASAAAKSLGLQFDASQVSAKGWMGFIQGVKDKLKEVAPEYVAAKDKVEALESQMKSGSGTVANHSTEIENLKNKIKELSGSTTEVADYSNKIAELRTQLTKLNGEASKTKDSNLKQEYKDQAQAVKEQISKLQELETQSKTTAKGVKQDNKDQVEAIKKQVEALEAQDKAQKSTGTSTKDLATELKNAKADMAGLEKGSTSQISAFATMFGSVEALNTVLTLTSDQGASLYNDSMKQMSDGTDLVNDAFNKVNNTSGKDLAKTLNELKNAGIKFGEALEPVLTDVTSIISGLTKKLEGMDEGTMKTVANVGLFTVGLGAVLKISGSVIGTVGSITKVIGLASTAFGTATVAAEGVGTASTVAAGIGSVGGVAGLGAALGGIAIAAAPWLLAGAAVVATGYEINNAMSKEAIPAVDLFADKVVTTSKTVSDSNGYVTQSYDTVTTKISDSTEKAVGAYIKLDDNATKSLTNLYINSTVITGETATALTTKYSEMNNNIKAGMDKHYATSLDTMRTFFNSSSALATSEEAKILADIKKNNEDKKTEEDNYNKQIQAIIKKASDEKRALTLEDQQKINEIQNKMKTNAVKAMSDTEVESKVILERLKDYGTRITAEQASEEIKNANKTKDESIAAAKEKYDKVVSEIVRERDETHTITEDQAAKLIASATLQKEDSIKQAGLLKDGVVEKITAMNTDTAKSVDLNTGKILTYWDKLKNWWDSWFPSTKTMTVVTNYASAGVPSSPTTSSGGNGLPYNYSGNSNFDGGFTTLHEKGYEVYDLPRGTRIYNHDASEDMIMKTAEAVAAKMIDNTNNGSKGITQNLVINSPTALSPSEIARQNKKALQELALGF